MIYIFLIILSLCAVLCDYIIWMALRVYFRSKIGVRVFAGLFWTYTLSTAIAIPLLIVFGYHWPFYNPNTISALPLWLFWFFLTSALSKLIYAICLGMGRLAGKWRNDLEKYWRYFGLICAVLVVFMFVKGAFYNAHHIKIKYVALESKKIPAAFDGYRIVFFSDLHLGNLAFKKRYLNQIVETINAQHPDLVVHTGDLVHMYATEIDSSAASILSRIHGTDGVYGVLGNHDMGVYFQARQNKIGLTPAQNTAMVIAKQEQMHWTILRNQLVHIHRGDSAIGLCGLSYPPDAHFSASLTDFNPELTTKNLDTAQYNIMLSHTPALWDTIIDSKALKKIDLMLSGHTHATQLKVNVRKYHGSPSSLRFHYWSGLYEHNGRKLYVNEGLGYVLYPLRIGTYPEITVFTLQHQKH